MLVRLIALLLFVYMFWRWLRPSRRQSVGFSSKASCPSPWLILGVKPGADENTCRRAYQDLVQQYHPDKVANLGPELQQLAHDKTRELNDAYNQLKKNTPPHGK